MTVPGDDGVMQLGAMSAAGELPHLAMGLLNQALALLPAFAAAPQRLLAGGEAVLLGPLAIIPVAGVLVHGAGDVWWGMRSYSDIRSELAEAMDNGTVRAIVLLTNSPGGHCSGLFELADTIFEARAQKPIIAVLDDSAYSAAYCIAAAAEEVVVPESGAAGSIGCVVIHTDISGMLAQVGVAATVIRSAPQKMEGNEFEPLGDDTRARIQADVDALADMFVDRVARYRLGKITAQQVRETQGGTFLGSKAVDLGLADKVMPPEEAIAELLAAFSQN